MFLVESAGPLWATRLRSIFFATCTLDILEILQIPNITIWLLCRHVYCNLQAGYTVTLIFGVLQPSGLVAANPPGVGALPPPDLGLRILGGPPPPSPRAGTIWCICSPYAAICSPCAPICSPCAAKCNPCAAICSPCAAKEQPNAVPVQPHAAPVQPYATPVQPYAAPVQPKCSQMQPLCSQMQPL